jgi:epoxyqueuosine reductase
METEKDSITPGSEEARRVAQALRRRAIELGLDRVGLAAIDRPVPREVLETWLADGRHAGMDYLARRGEVRLDPRHLMRGVRCVVSAALNYHVSSPAGSDDPNSAARVARFAWGRDYHEVLGSRLRRLGAWLSRRVPSVESRVLVDTAPFLERHWAAEAGVGWIGRNGSLIVPGIGSWVFLGELLLDLPLPADRPMPSRCGACRRCLEACPGGALSEQAPMDARRCISYWTVEHCGPFPEEGRPRISPWLFGCDRCQEVCPHNVDAPDTREPEWAEAPVWVNWRRPQWHRLNADEFDRIFSRTPLSRTGFHGLRRNLDALEREAGGSGRESSAGRLD